MFVHFTNALYLKVTNRRHRRIFVRQYANYYSFRRRDASIFFSFFFFFFSFGGGGGGGGCGGAARVMIWPTLQENNEQISFL